MGIEIKNSNLHVVLLFLDGIGVGKKDPEINPFLLTPAKVNIPLLSFPVTLIAGVVVKVDKDEYILLLLPEINMPGLAVTVSKEQSIK